MGNDKWIEEIVGVFCDPIIVMPGGWGDTLPKWLKEAITLQRLIANMEGIRNGKMTGTDAEACAYLYTASLTNPIDHDWAQIYLYIAGKVYEGHRTKDSGVKMPEDIRVESLSKYQMDQLNHLKLWIYERRVRNRKDKARGERAEQKKAKEADDILQMSFDLGLQPEEGA